MLVHESVQLIQIGTITSQCMNASSFLFFQEIEESFNGGLGVVQNAKKGEWSVDNFAFFILKTKVLLNHF